MTPWQKKLNRIAEGRNSAADGTMSIIGVQRAQEFIAGADWATRELLEHEAVDGLHASLSAVRSQLCWETDRDQATDGMRDLHTGITKALAAFEKFKKELE